MILLTTIDTAAKNVPTDAPLRADKPEGAQSMFADMFALDADGDDMSDSKAVVVPVETEVIDDIADDMGLATPQDAETKPIPAKTPELGLAQLLPSRDAVIESRPNTFENRQSALVSIIASDVDPRATDAKAEVETAKIKEAILPGNRPSFAQSAIESQLPKAGLTAPTQDASPTLKMADAVGIIDDAKVQSSGVVPSPNFQQTKAPATSPIALATAAAVLVETPKGREGATVPPVARDSSTSPSTPVLAPSPVSQVKPGPPPAVAIAQSLLAQDPRSTETQAKPLEAEFALSLSGGERSVTSTATSGPNPASSNGDTARQIATQIAVAVSNGSGKATEIALNPEELGRVRLSMTATDGAITLHLSTERPETQDLLRRHADVLAQEFRDLGYDTISFSFGQEGQTKQDEAADHVDHQSSLDANDTPESQGPAQTASSSGLDLRI